MQSINYKQPLYKVHARLYWMKMQSVIIKQHVKECEGLTSESSLLAVLFLLTKEGRLCPGITLLQQFLL